ncbi:MAG: formylglycine-generating enzyme family protein [bacterium]|nr:formylglycine-generating enzyme family protein [bacterium]
MKKIVPILLLLVIAGNTLPVYPDSKKVKTELLKGEKEILPFFAADKNQNNHPITTLKKSEITLLINNQNVRDFSIFKRNFFSEPQTENTIQKHNYLFYDTISLSPSQLQQAETIANYIQKSTGITGKTYPNPANNTTGEPSLLNSLRQLHHGASGEEGTKFIYFFSTDSIAVNVNTAATLLGESGALLMVINPTSGSSQASRSTSQIGNTQNLLQQLTKSCGGLYLSGDQTAIIKQLNTLHRSYYEIVFPFLRQLTKGDNQILLGSNRNNVRIHSLNYLRKNKPIAEITELQKDILALTLIQNNDWYHLQLASLNPHSNRLQTDTPQTNPNPTIPSYGFTLPPDFVGDDILFYKVTMDNDNENKNENKNEDITVNPGSITPTTPFLKIDRDEESHFVLVNLKKRAALVIRNQSAPGAEAEASKLTRAIARRRERIDTLRKEDRLILVRTGAIHSPGREKETTAKPKLQTVNPASLTPVTGTGTKADALEKLEAFRLTVTDPTVNNYIELAIKNLNEGQIGYALFYLRKVPSGHAFVERFVRELTGVDDGTNKMLMKLDVLAEPFGSPGFQAVRDLPEIPRRKSRLRRLLAAVQVILEANRRRVDSVVQILEQLPRNFRAPLLTSSGYKSGRNLPAMEDRLEFCRGNLEILKNNLPQIEAAVFVQEDRLGKIVEQLETILARESAQIRMIKQRFKEIETVHPDAAIEFVIANSHIFSPAFRSPYFKKRLQSLGAKPALMKQSPFFDVVIRSRSAARNLQGYWEAGFSNDITLIYIPGGEFFMGVPWESGGAEDESPRHKVYLDGYWISKYETIFDQYDRFCGDTGRGKVPNHGRSRKNRPVIGVSWADAQEFCQWLSIKNGLIFRLPTEAEWEKAARGAGSFKFPWGNGEPSGKRANFADSKFLKKYLQLNPPGNKKQKAELTQWMAKSVNDGHIYTAPVGSYPLGASPYGVMDMAGNVWEWVFDWYDSDYYHRSPRRNPRRASRATYKVARGGGWDCHSWLLRSTGRAGCDPSKGNDTLGFRVAALAGERK